MQSRATSRQFANVEGLTWDVTRCDPDSAVLFFGGRTTEDDLQAVSSRRWSGRLIPTRRARGRRASGSGDYRANTWATRRDEVRRRPQMQDPHGCVGRVACAPGNVSRQSPRPGVIRTSLHLSPLAPRNLLGERIELRLPEPTERFELSIHFPQRGGRILHRRAAAVCRLGAPPPTWFIDALLRWEDEAYYVALLKAAELHAATHQAVMQFQVACGKRLSEIRAGRNEVVFYYRKEMSAPSPELKTARPTRAR